MTKSSSSDFKFKNEHHSFNQQTPLHYPSSKSYKLRNSKQYSVFKVCT